MTAWAKMSSNLDSNPKIRKAGRNGREVFLFIIRRNSELDMAGRIPEAHVEAWYLADQLMMPESDAVSGLSACVRTGLLRIEDGHAVIVGWDDEWGKRPMTEAERKRLERAVKAAKTPSTDNHSTDNQVSGQVTNVSGQVVTSPDCHGSEEKREEEKRVEENRDAAPAKPSRSRSTKVLLPEGWTPDRNDPNDNAWREAQARGVDCRLELVKFRDHALSNAWKKIDWQATWRNWTRNAKPTVRNGNQPGNGLQAVLEIARGES
jgi:hypothetical protein